MVQKFCLLATFMKIELFVEKINLNRFCFFIFLFIDHAANQNMLTLPKASYFQHYDLTNLLLSFVLNKTHTDFFTLSELDLSG